MMKKFAAALVGVLVLSFCLANSVKADKAYDYELSDGMGKAAEDKVSDFMKELPDDIKKELPKKRDAQSFESYDFDFFAGVAGKALREAVVPALGTASELLGIVVIASAFHIFSKSMGGSSLESVFSFCSGICVSLAVFEGMGAVFDSVDWLLTSVSNTMLAVIPAMEAVYIASGNLTTATVSATGINLMIGFTESLFAKIISPSVYALFIISVASSVTKNKGLEFMQRTLKMLITGVVIAIMALMTFVLALQTMAGSAADSVGAKAVRFAIGTYIPIVGGSIAETFSLLSASVGVIKSWLGITAVAALLIVFSLPFANVLLTRIAIGLTGAVSEVLGCEREGALLSECKGICDLLLAVSIAACVMYIVALGIFFTTTSAVG